MLQLRHQATKGGCSGRMRVNARQEVGGRALFVYCTAMKLAAVLMQMSPTMPFKMNIQFKILVGGQFTWSTLAAG